MKIKELWIKDYKILNNFNIDFESQLTVMIGENGSGKSTFIEIIAKIFFDLYLHFVLEKGKRPDVDFKIRYEIDYVTIKYEVYIVSNKNTKEYYEVNLKKDGEELIKYSKAKINKDFLDAYKDILPKNFVMYYSGISTILMDRFIEFQEDLIESSVKGKTKIEQPFFYFLPNNFSMILIGLLSYQYGDIPETLNSQFDISGFKEIKIEIKKPDWAKNSEIDSFWGAEGDLKVFLNILKENCKKKVIRDNSIDFVFTTKEELENTWSPYGEEKNLFEYLTTLQANDLIGKVDITLTKCNQLISFDRLSEGEKQFLTIFGLNELLITGNTVFLLDEPDTYLHPEWQRDFIKSMVDIQKNKANFLITSHSPNIISGLKKEQLKIIENRNNKSIIREFSFNPFGKPVDMILIDYFGLNGLRFKDINDEIKKLQRMIIKDRCHTDEFKSLYAELERKIGKDDIELLSIKLEKIKREKVNAKN